MTTTLTTRHGYAPVTYEMDEDNTIHRITFHLPPGAAWAGPDGAPVAARDDAAELRAAVREFFKAEAAVAALYHPNGIYTDFYEAADIANAARENLRRLAASEGQS